MKHSTKDKIVRFIKNLLNYNDSTPTIVEHRNVQIQEIIWTGVIYEYDHLHRLKHCVSSEIAKKLIDMDLIKIKSTPIGKQGLWQVDQFQVCAKLSVVLIDGGQDFEYGD